MKRHGVVCVCWVVVPMCSGYGVGGVCGSAVESDFGEDRWPSASGYFGLDAEEVRLLTCSK